MKYKGLFFIRMTHEPKNKFSDTNSVYLAINYQCSVTMGDKNTFF
jgi:hypothetical protein